MTSKEQFLPKIKLKKNTAWREEEVNGETVQVPVGWGVKRVSDISKHTAGGTPSTENAIFWGGGLCWITPSDMDNLKGTKILESVRTLTKEGYESMSKKAVVPNSVIFSTRGSIGKVAVNVHEVRISQSCESFFFKNHNCDFIAYWFRKNIHTLKNSGAGTTFMSITKADILRVQIPTPPLPEQNLIAQILSTQEERIHSLEEEAQMEEKRLNYLSQESC